MSAQRMAHAGAKNAANLRSDARSPSPQTGAPVLDDGLPVQEDDDVVVGSAAGLAPVLERLAMVAPTDAPVLLEGETGSGKELLARHLHARSQRRDGPMIRVNCGALPPELVDSELF